MNENTQDLTQRVKRLEQENRRLKRIGGVSIAVVGAIGLMSMAAPRLCKTVWGERFILADKYGKERMVLDAYATKSPTMTFKDKKGRKVVNLSVDDAGDVSVQLHKDGVATTTGKLRVGRDGTPILDFGSGQAVAGTGSGSVD